MALTVPKSYVPATRAFLAHWKLANDALPPGAPVILPAGCGGFPAPVTIEDLHDLFEDPVNGLLAQRTAVTEWGNTLSSAAAAAELKKTALLARAVAVNAHVRTWFGGSKWLGSLAKAPNPGHAAGRFLHPLDATATQWAAMEEETGSPIVLRGDYGLASFVADLAALRAAYAAWGNAGMERKMAIATRTATEARLRALLKTYRAVIQLRFAPDSPVTLTLPRYSRVRKTKKAAETPAG